MPRLSKKPQKPLAYGHGHIARAPNGRGYDASVYLPDGRRRARLPTLAEAKAWLDAQDPADTVALTAAQLRDAKTAFALLPHGATLTQAAQALAIQADEARRALDLPALAEDYLLRKSKTLRPATLATYRRVLNALIPKLAQPLTRAGLEAALAGKTPHARNTAIRSLSAFFAWCAAIGAIDRNPTEGLRLARVNEPARTILTLRQTRALLAHAQSHAAILLPYLPLCLFAGLRPDEAKRLRPDHIGPEYITLTPAITKTAAARTVSVSPNLRAWLTRHPLPPEGATHGLSPDRFKKRLTQESRAAGIVWAPDILRHTFASYAYERTRDAAATAYEMGHQGTAIFFRHYRGLVPPGEGEAFFSILPD